MATEQQFFSVISAAIDGPSYSIISVQAWRPSKMAKGGLKEVTAKEFKAYERALENERKRAYKWHLKRGSQPTEKLKCPALAELRKKVEEEQRGQSSSYAFAGSSCGGNGPGL